MRITRWPVAVTAVLGVTLAGCGDPAPGTLASGTTAEAPALRIVTSFAVENLDPIDQGFWMPEFGVAETPMRALPDGDLAPWGVESLEQVDDTTWTLTLREGVTFQNGKPLDAAALAATMSRQLAESASAQAGLPGASVAATGPDQVTLTTEAPEATVPHVLADESAFPIYDVELVESVGDDHDALAGAGIYTGPYAVRSLDDRRLELDAHPGHWAGTPPLPGVEVRFVTDPQARVLAVQNDEADIALYVPTDVADVLDDDDRAFFVTPERGTGTVTMPLNIDRAPFDELAVRRAFILGVDYESLAGEVLPGAYDVATSMYPPLYPFADDTLRTDPQAAAALLDEAGWEPGADGARVRDGERLRVVLLTYPQQPDTGSFAVAVQAQLGALGFDVSIRQVDDINAALGETEDWDTALWFSGTAGFTGSTEPFLRRHLVTDGDRNYGGVSDPELDALTEQLGATFDEAERAELLSRIQEVATVEQAYLTVAGHKRFPVVVGPGWRDYQPSNSLNHVTADTRPDA